MKNNKKNEYVNLTSLIYQELSWLPLYIKKDGKVIANADINWSKNIFRFIKSNETKAKRSKKKKFLILEQEESRFFASHGADVTHIDMDRSHWNWGIGRKKISLRWIQIIQIF